jgi:NAD+ synthase
MISPGDIARQIATWLRDYAVQAEAQGYVVGLSGGIDSACTAALCQQAVGGNVLALWLPCHSPPEDAAMAHLVIERFALRSVAIDLGMAYDALIAAQPAEVSPLAQANIKPRLRMTALYAQAQTHNYLVAGTGNKSELAVGYFTKYGDGGVDVEPLGDLYKGQVRLLARELGVPQPIIDRPPSAGLWPGQTDEDEMGITYDNLDAILAAFEGGQTREMVVAQHGAPVVDRVLSMMAASAHKRAMPPICPIDMYSKREPT